VLESERVGLWFHRYAGQSRGCTSDVKNAFYARALTFRTDYYSYRPAPPGVKEGDAYDPALYGEEV